MGSREFTETIHISTYDVYKRLFSPPKWKMFVLPNTPRCTWIRFLPCEYFSFSPAPPLSMRLSLLMYLLGHSTANLQVEALPSRKMFYMP